MSPRSRFDVPRETAVVVGLVSGSHVVNHMYLVLFPPILGVLAAEFDAGLAELGAAMGLQAAVNTAFQLPFGYLSDAHDRTLTLGLCLVLGAAGAGVLAVAPTFEWLLVGQAVLGVGVAGHHPAHFPLLSDATPEASRGRAFSVHGFAGNLGFAAPPVVIVGVTSLPGLTWRHAFGLVAAVGLAYAALAVYVLLAHVPAAVRRPNRNEGGDEGARSLGERVRAEAAALAGSPAILALGVLALVASTAMWGVTSFVVTLLEGAYGVDGDLASLTLSAMFGVGALFMLAGGDLADRVAPGPVILGSYLLVAGLVATLATLAVPPLAAVAVAVLAGGVGSLATPARDKLADVLSARADLGRNFAVVTVGIMVGSTVAPPVFGAAIETAGFRVAFGAIAAVALGVVGVTVAVLLRWGDGVNVAATPAD